MDIKEKEAQALSSVILSQAATLGVWKDHPISLGDNTKCCGTGQHSTWSCSQDTQFWARLSCLCIPNPGQDLSAKKLASLGSTRLWDGGMSARAAEPGISRAEKSLQKKKKKSKQTHTLVPEKLIQHRRQVWRGSVEMW